MAKKRPTLDAFLNPGKHILGEENSSPDLTAIATEETLVAKKVTTPAGAEKNASVTVTEPKKPEIIRHMLYLPLPVYDQLQELIFEEQRGQAKRRKTHDYLLDAIDLLFKKKGLKPISELNKGSD